MKTFSFFLLSLLFVGAGCISTAGIRQDIPVGWSSYSSPRFGFEIALSPSADIAANTLGQVDLGRQGGVVITDHSTVRGEGVLNVGVYDSQEQLEKDFGVSENTSLDAVFAHNGLEPVKGLQVAGAERVAYAGTHAVDGVGGRPFSYVWVEVVGEDHVYYMGFQNFSTDPIDPQIQNYLNSFEFIK